MASAAGTGAGPGPPALDASHTPDGGTPRQIALAHLTPHLVCALCGGYYIDATTIVECLHTFCRSCILRHLETSSYCPAITCDVMIHRTKGAVSLRPDLTLQSIVYKSVPGLHRAEMHRRKLFYTENPGADSELPSYMKGSIEEGAGRYYAPDDTIDVRIQYASPLSDEVVPVRYLRCPAGLPLAVLKKFLFQKYRLPDHLQMELIHGRKVLPQDIQLLDVAYLVNWSRKSALKLMYRLSKLNTASKRSANGDALATQLAAKNRKIEYPASSPNTTRHSSESDSSASDRLPLSTFKISKASTGDEKQETDAGPSEKETKKSPKLSQIQESEQNKMKSSLFKEIDPGQLPVSGIAPKVVSSASPTPATPVQNISHNKSSFHTYPTNVSQPPVGIYSNTPAAMKRPPLSTVPPATKLAHSYKASSQKASPISSSKYVSKSQTPLKNLQKPKQNTKPTHTSSYFSSSTMEKKMAKLSQAYIANKQALKSMKKSAQTATENKTNMLTATHSNSTGSPLQKPVTVTNADVGPTKGIPFLGIVPIKTKPSSTPTPTTVPGNLTNIPKTVTKPSTSDCSPMSQVNKTQTQHSNKSNTYGVAGVEAQTCGTVPVCKTSESVTASPKHGLTQTAVPPAQTITSSNSAVKKNEQNGRVQQPENTAPAKKIPVTKVDCSVQTMPIQKVHMSKQSGSKSSKTITLGTNTQLSSTPRSKPSEDNKQAASSKSVAKVNGEPKNKEVSQPSSAKSNSGVLDLSTHSRETSASAVANASASKESKTIFVIAGGKKVQGSTKIQSIVESLAQKRLQTASSPKEAQEKPQISTASSPQPAEIPKTSPANPSEGRFLVPSASSAASKLTAPTGSVPPSSTQPTNPSASASVSSPLHIDTYSSCLPPLSSLASTQSSSRPVFPVLPLPQRPRSQAVHRNIPNPSLVRQRSAEERARLASKGSPTAGSTAPAISPTTELHSLTRQLQEAGTSVTITNSTTT